MNYGFAAIAAVSVVTGAMTFAVASPAEAQSRGLPRGSYVHSCSDTYVARGRLFAECRDMRGRDRFSSIDLERCGRNEISNQDGLLVCRNVRGQFENNNPRGPQDRPGRGWDNSDNNRPGHGGWQNQREPRITIFADSRYRGSDRSFDGPVSNLVNVRFNDVASSVRVSRGTWELCEHANFRGRCVTISDDVRDLSGMGMNDKVSSLRPVSRR